MDRRFRLGSLGNLSTSSRSDDSGGEEESVVPSWLVRLDSVFFRGHFNFLHFSADLTLFRCLISIFCSHTQVLDTTLVHEFFL